MFLFPKWTALPVYWPEQTAEMTYISPSLQLRSFSTLYSLLVTELFMRPDLFCMPIGQTMQPFKLHSWTTEDLLLLLNRTRPNTQAGRQAGGRADR